MREKINQALKKAMKDKESDRVNTLRLINAAIKDREIAARGQDRDGVSDNEIIEILSRMIKQRRDSIKAFSEGGRDDLASQEQKEIDIISEFMPRQLDEEETRKACREVIEELGAGGLKDMGKVMGELKQRHMGEMDFSLASRMVKEILG